MRRVWIFAFVLLFCLPLFSACSRARSNRENQIPLPFTATIEGTRGELAFCAEISASVGKRVIRYTMPESLSGLTITQTNAGIEMRQGEFLATDQPAAKGYLAPLDLLLSPAQLSSVEERNGEQTLIYTDGTKLILQADGTPRAVIGNDIFYTISNFETVGVQK